MGLLALADRRGFPLERSHRCAPHPRDEGTGQNPQQQKKGQQPTHGRRHIQKPPDFPQTFSSKRDGLRNAQKLVGHVVPEGVVELLEMIQIDAEEGQGVPVKLGVAHPGAKQLLKGTGVVEPRSEVELRTEVEI